MAQDFSSEYLRELRFPHLPALHLRLGARRLLQATRNAQRRWRPGSVVASRVPSRQLVTPALEAQGEALRDRGWAFCEDVLDADFHADLLAGWPSRRYLTPASDLLKSWDRGFGWRRGHSADPPYLERHPALRRFLDELRAPAFAQRLTELIGADTEVSCYSFLVTMTIPGSVVAPHRDSWAYLEDGPRHAYNIVFFIDGTGGERSGGLSILGSNTFDEVIFESRKLRNTALVYDILAPFYHGFQPVRFGKFRWAVITNFLSADFRS